MSRRMPTVDMALGFAGGSFASVTFIALVF